MHPTYIFGLLACNTAVMSVTQASAQQTCKPALAITEVHYSGMQPPKLQRTWTAVLSVDASSCLTSSGHFEIAYAMEKENAPDFQFREQFMWKPGSVKVSREFWADEAVAAYRVDNIAPCPCRK
jgi:hypothetical protein